MHFLQALVLIFVILVFAGAPGGSLAHPQSDRHVTQIGDVFANCPAAAAGIRPDDQIVSINGQRLNDYSELGVFIAPLANQEATFVVRRHGVDRSVPVFIVPRDDTPGSPGMLGVSYGPRQPALKRTNPISAIPATFSEFGSMMGQTIPAFFKAFSPSNLRSYGKQVVNAQQDRDHPASTDPSAPTTVLEGSPAAKPVTNVTTQTCRASMGGEAAFKSKQSASNPQDGRFLSIVGIFNIGRGMASSGGIADLLFLFVVVNIFIGVFNLIPMLPFDGGHIAIAMYERVQEWRHHTRQRYYADMNKLLPVVYVMIVLLGLLFVSSLYLDITNPLSVK